MDYPEKVFITLFLSPKRYNLLNDIINYNLFGGSFHLLSVYLPPKGYNIILSHI